MNNETSLLLAVLLREACRVGVRAGLSNGLPHDQATIDWLQGGQAAFSAPVIDILRGGGLAADKIVEKGLSLAAGGRRGQTETGAEQLAPLLSIFSKVSLTPAVKDPRFHRLDEDPDALALPAPLAECQPSRKQYQGRWDAFEADLQQVKDALTVDTLLVLMEKHFSVVPAFLTNGSAAEEWVSLYDYAKTAIALICALWRHAAEQPPRSSPPFLLIGGDLSGVQDFVYSIPSRGALKTLRGRSFFLELLTHHVVEELLRGLRLSRANIIFAGGGGFRLLTPNSEDVRKAVDTLRRCINRHLLHKFDGRLSLCLETTDLMEDDLHTADCIAERWRSLAKFLDRAKEKKFADDLSYLLQALPQEGKECRTCHRILPRLVEKEDFCFDCWAFKEMGQRLGWLPSRLLGCWSKPPRLASDPRKQLPYIYLPGIRFNAYYAIPDEKTTLPPTTLHVLHSVVEAKDYTAPNRRPFLLARYAQRLGDLPPYAQRAKLEKGETPDSIAEFADLARASCGRQLLGAIRLDADNAGMLISEGLKETPDLASVGALCRQISRFFTAYLDYICQGDLSAWAGKVAPCRIAREGSTTPRSLVIIYSGGEDLFLVGAWNEVVEVAFEIQQAYKLFTAENRDIDLSAGITLHKPKFPVYQMARLSGEALAKAKGNLQDCKVREECKKAKEECLFFLLHPEKILCAARKGSVALFHTPELVARNKQIREEMQTKKLLPEDRIALALPWSQVRAEVMGMTHFFVQHFGQPDADRILFSLPTTYFRRLFDLVEIWRREGALYMPWLEQFWQTLHSELEKQADNGNWQTELNNLRKRLGETFSWVHLPLAWLENLRRREGEDYGP